MKCSKCGEENCEEKRAAFAREPWLPPAFEIGAQWRSFDNGLTWERFPVGAPHDGAREASMTITSVNLSSGEIVAKVIS